jgi:hypothetical protein
MKNSRTFRFLQIAIVLILLIESNRCKAQSMPMPYFFPGFSPQYYWGRHSPVPPYFKSVPKTYVITLKNDSVIKVFEKINLSGSVNSIKVPDGKSTKKIYPDDTKEIYELQADGSKYIGIPAKDSWLFITRTGKITSYTIIPMTECDFVTAIQKDNEPIIDLTLENLKPLIAGNADATRLAEKHKDLVRAIKVYNEQTR